MLWLHRTHLTQTISFQPGPVDSSYVTWGTSPDQAIPITGRVPAAEGSQGGSHQKAMDYTGLAEGAELEGLAVQHVFIGSCTNGRIEDLREVAAVVKGQQVSSGVRAMVVPGSGAVRDQAESEGIARILIHRCRV